jgi:SAGA-associated factor 29
LWWWGGGGGGGGGADIASLLEKAKELDQLKKDQDEMMVEINKMHKKVLASKILSSAVASYPTAHLLLSNDVIFFSHWNVCIYECWYVFSFAAC